MVPKIRILYFENFLTIILSKMSYYKVKPISSTSMETIVCRRSLRSENNIEKKKVTTTMKMYLSKLDKRDNEGRVDMKTFVQLVLFLSMPETVRTIRRCLKKLRTVILKQAEKWALMYEIQDDAIIILLKKMGELYS